MKFILLATNASLMALVRQPIGKLRDDPDMRAVVRRLQRGDRGRQRRGVALPADARREDAGLQPTARRRRMKPSMALDLERGNRIELPWLGGKVVELGRQLGVPTPSHSLMYAALKPYVMGTPA